MKIALLMALSLLVAAQNASAAASEATFAKLNGTSSQIACFGMIAQMADLNTKLNQTLASNNKTLQALYDATDKLNPKRPKFKPTETIYMFENKAAHTEVVSRINAFGKTVKDVKDTKTMIAFQELVSSDMAKALEKQGVDYYPKCENEFRETADKCKGFADNQELLKGCFTREMTSSESLKKINGSAAGNTQLERIMEQQKKETKI